MKPPDAQSHGNTAESATDESMRRQFNSTPHAVGGLPSPKRQLVVEGQWTALIASQSQAGGLLGACLPGPTCTIVRSALGAWRAFRPRLCYR